MGTEECVLKVANMLPVHRDYITILKMLLNEGDAGNLPKIDFSDQPYLNIYRYLCPYLNDLLHLVSVRFCTLEPAGKVCNRFQSKKKKKFYN
ncbi:hypothetical protein HanPI659440_Chr01g0016241 [Helianthus annuus]|nr:hypothetical protein HanPI659440_Chr01g0016241 [Helianthus annuus]